MIGAVIDHRGIAGDVTMTMTMAMCAMLGSVMLGGMVMMLVGSSRLGVGIHGWGGSGLCGGFSSGRSGVLRECGCAGEGKAQADGKEGTNIHC